MTKPDIDLRGKRGDIRYSCDECGWSVTLTPEGEGLWTKDRTIVPTCTKDHKPLIRTVVMEDPK